MGLFSKKEKRFRCFTILILLGKLDSNDGSRLIQFMERITSFL